MSTTTTRFGLKKAETSDFLDTVLTPDIATSMQLIDDLVAKRCVPGAAHNLAGLTVLGDLEDTAVAIATLALDSAVVKLLGRAGGQIIYGGTAASNNLILHSTNTGTKGIIGLGSNSAYDEANDRLGIGTISPADTVEIFKSAAQLNALTLTNYYTGANHCIIVGRSARGTSGSPLHLNADDIMLMLAARGYGTGMGASEQASIAICAAEDWGASAQGTYLLFKTTPIGTTSITEKLRLDDNGIKLAGQYLPGPDSWMNDTAETWT